MKRYLITIPLLSVFALAGCQKTAVSVEPDYSAKAITFAAPGISYEVRSTALNAFPDGGVFGVYGYCLPEDVNGNPDPTSGDVIWQTKRVKNSPDVYFNVPVVRNGSTCSYITTGAKTWYQPDDYLYTFFAYYPYGEYSTGYTPVTTISTEDDYAEPSVRFEMPFSGGTIDQRRDHKLIPDVMMAAQIDVLGYKPVRFTFHHALTALRFRVNNLNDKAGLTIHSITLRGTYYRSIDITLDGNYKLNDTDKYKGTHYLIDAATDVTNGSSIDSETLLLICNTAPVGDNDYIGSKDIRLVIDYTFNGNRTQKEYERPASFAPKSGTRYTAMLNFVGDTFVIQVVPEDTWETGCDDDIKFE